MSKKKKLQTPAPTFQQDPRFTQGIESLQNLGGRISNFDFTGSLSPLAETIALDPESTSLALEQAQSVLGPAFEDSINQIKQEAANNNQLESSTFTDALSRESGRLNQQFQGIVAGAGLEDRNRALENRIRLEALGGGLTQQGTAFAGQNQSERNDFNLRNFENQVFLEQANSQKSRGGFIGGLKGFLGGGIGGGLAGGFGPPGTGEAILSVGSQIKSLAGFPTSAPGISAGNTADLFGGSQSSFNSNDFFNNLKLGNSSSRGL